MKRKLRVAVQSSAKHVITSTKYLFFFFVVIFWSNVSAQTHSHNAYPKYIGPYVQMPGKDHVYIYWTELKYTIIKGSSEDSTDTTDSIWEHKKYYLMPPLDMLMKGERNLAYEISGIGKGKIKLAPKDWNSSFEFIVFGDNKSWHTNKEESNECYHKIIKLVKLRNPEFVLNTGDIVFDGREYRDWLSFFEISEELMKNVPYFPVVGNHEESSQPLFEFFEFPENRSYYSFNWGQAHIIVLNSCGLEPLIERRKYHETDWKKYLDEFPDKVEKPFFNEQLSWLKADLETHKDFPFIFISFHYPVFNTSTRDYENYEIIQNDWKPLLNEYQVSAVFNGHNHHYHHVYETGVHYVITAGAGAGLHKREVPPFQNEVKYAFVHHFISVNVKTDICECNVYDLDDSLVESFSIKKRKTM